MLSVLTRWKRLVFVLVISMQINVLVSNDLSHLILQSGLLNDTLIESNNSSIGPFTELYDFETNSTNISDRNEPFDTLVEEIELNITSSLTTKLTLLQISTSATTTTTTTRKVITKTTTKEPHNIRIKTTKKTTSGTKPTNGPTTSTTTTTTTYQIYETSTRPKKKATTLDVKKTTESVNSTETFINKLYPNSRNLQNDSFIR